MKISKLIEYAQVKDKETWVDLEPLCAEFGIFHMVEDKENVFSMKDIYNWVDTDTYVGLNLYYFKRTPLCFTYQTYRKSEVKVYWLSKILMRTARNYILNIYHGENEEFLNIVNKSDELDDIIETRILKANSDYE